jgi:hypothetical protein
MTDIADTLSEVLCTDDLVRADWIACKICSGNFVLPLLHALQTSDCPDNRENKKQAIVYLDFLVQFSRKRLARAGWNIKRKGSSLGSFIFQHTLSGEQSETPVIEEPPTWTFALLQMMSLLIVHGETAAAEELWAVKVLHHSVTIATVLTQLAALVLNPLCEDDDDDDDDDIQENNNSPSHQWSIIEVLKFPGEDDASVSLMSSASQQRRRRTQKKQQQGSEQSEVETGLQNSTIVRQLVVSTHAVRMCTCITPILSAHITSTLI